MNIGSLLFGRKSAAPTAAEFRAAADKGCTACDIRKKYEGSGQVLDHTPCPATAKFAAIGAAIGFVEGAQETLKRKDLTAEQRELAEFESQLNPNKPDHFAYIQSEMAKLAPK